MLFVRAAPTNGERGSRTKGLFGQEIGVGSRNLTWWPGVSGASPACFPGPASSPPALDGRAPELGAAEPSRGRAAGARGRSGPPGSPRDSDDPPGPRLPTAVLGTRPGTPTTACPGLPPPLPCSAPLTRGALGAGRRASGARGSPPPPEPHSGTRWLPPSDPCVADAGPGVRCGAAAGPETSPGPARSPPALPTRRTVAAGPAARPVPGDRCPRAAARSSAEEGARSSPGRRPRARSASPLGLGRGAVTAPVGTQEVTARSSCVFPLLTSPDSRIFPVIVNKCGFLLDRSLTELCRL